jgi:hypothetical protein
MTSAFANHALRKSGSTCRKIPRHQSTRRSSCNNMRPSTHSIAGVGRAAAFRTFGFSSVVRFRDRWSIDCQYV